MCFPINLAIMLFCKGVSKFFLVLNALPHPIQLANSYSSFKTVQTLHILGLTTPAFGNRYLGKNF